MTRPLLLAALFCSASLPALAATVTLTDTTAGFVRNEDDLALLIGAGTTVTGPVHAISLRNGENNTVTNAGTIEGRTRDGINASGDGLTVGNTGTITGADDGIQARDSLTVENAGTIRGADKGIDARDALRLTNTGVISAGDEGVEARDDAIIDNTGTITGVDDAVQVGENAQINNSGTIENVAADGRSPQDAIDLDSGTITNTGTIRSTFGDGIDFDASDEPATESVIVNVGTISGRTGIVVEKGLDGPANTAAQFIINAGLIEGTAGLALDLGAGADTLALVLGGVLIGGVDLGADDDVMAFQNLVDGGVAGGALLDGGAGTDTLLFNNFLRADLKTVTRSGSVLTLALANADWQLNLTTTNFETAVFADLDTLTLADLAPIPLPAGAPLLLAGLGMLVLRRRGR